ncbi:MAG: hypothetical protein DMG00_03290, partial [Acidobacteria bacterium]
VIRDKSGDGLVPSIVSIDEGGTVYVGREAQRRLLTDAGHTAYSVKRFMGKGIEDVRDEARHFPFRIGGEAGGVIRDLGDDPAEAQVRRRSLSRRGRRLGGDHRPRLLQRRSAPGDEGRRPDRRAGRQADHQRADGGVAGLRAR